MSQLTNNAYVARSMNGIISIDDGAGSTMEGGVITANELVIDEIQSKSPPNVVSLYTETTTVINVGSPTSTLNVSNLNVSNINVPLITFTTLNASTVNADDVNTSTSNASTSNSSTSNSSTSNSNTANNGTTNSSTSNSSTSNSDTANNTTTNSSTVNVSTLNFGTTSGTTINMNTVNASIVNTNEIQNISTANVSLYTGHTGNLYMGNISTNLILIDSKNTTLSSVNDTTITSGGEIYLNSQGDTEICSSGFSGKMVLSGNQEIRAKDRSMPSYLFTDAFTGGNLTLGNISTDLRIDSITRIMNGVKTNSIQQLATNNNLQLGTTTTTGNITMGNLTMAGNIFIRNAGGMYLGLTSTEVKIANVATNIELGIDLTTTGIVTIGTTGQTTINLKGTTNASTINASTINASTYNASTFNASTINASTYNATNINASSIITGELYSDYSELGNITFTNDTINTLAPTSTISLFPALTTGIVNLATNATTGAIAVGNAAATGSFSVSEGTININPKTVLNLANQIGTGDVNICKSNTFNGVMYIASTIPTSGANIINMGSTSTTINVNSLQTTINSNRDFTMNAGSGFNIRYNRAQIPVSVPYSANTGTNVNGSVGRIMVGTITRANGFAIVDNVDTEYGNITNLEVGVWVIYSKIGVLSAGAVTIQTQGSYIKDSAGFVVSESKYMGTSQGSTPAGRIYWYENCATYSCFTTTTLRVFLALDWGGGSNTASTANNRFTATRIA